MACWYRFTSPDDAGFDTLAERLHLHPLHLEDARNTGERVKVENGRGYTFALLKAVTRLPGSDEPTLKPISIFAGHAREKELGSTGNGNGESEPFFIVIADLGNPDVAAALGRAEEERSTGTPGRLLYLTFDSIVDSYFPAVDAIDEKLDMLEDRVVKPSPDLLNDIFAVKRRLINTRRLLVSTRDAAMHLQRSSGIPMDSEHQLYLRDLYDHISRLLDTVESQRDLLNNALDIYLSSLANRTNEVVKVLTVLSTIALPALVVTGAYGMNVKGLPFVSSNHAASIVLGLTALLTAGLLMLLRYLCWI